MSEDRKNNGPTPAGSCWQCERPLGTGPDNCLTCTAKRAEDRARLPQSGGHDLRCGVCGGWNTYDDSGRPACSACAPVAGKAVLP